MNTLTEVIAKIDALLAYSVTQDEENSEAYTNICNTLKTAVNGYYKADRTSFKVPMNDLQLTMYNDVLKRGTRYEKVNYTMGAVTGADDLRKLFYTFPLMHVTDEAFFNAWVRKVDETTGTDTITNNTLIDKWLSDLSTVVDKELQNVNNLVDKFVLAGSDAGMTLLWEDMGNITKTVNTTDIAKELFINRGMLDVIKTLNIPAYTPTYLK